MTRYTCYKCKAENGTDNMVAYCASCVSSLERELAEAKAEIKRIEGERAVGRDRMGNYTAIDILTKLDVAEARVKELEAMNKEAWHTADEQRKGAEAAEAKLAALSTKPEVDPALSGAVVQAAKVQVSAIFAPPDIDLQQAATQNLIDSVNALAAAEANLPKSPKEINKQIDREIEREIVSGEKPWPREEMM